MKKYSIIDSDGKTVASISCASLDETISGETENFYVRTGKDGRYAGTLYLTPECHVEVVIE
jgi:hypothetical protein